MRTLMYADDSLGFSLNRFDNLSSFKKLFEGIKKSLEKEQKEIIFHKKPKEEESDYFSVMKFFFSSPDAI